LNAPTAIHVCMHVEIAFVITHRLSLCDKLLSSLWMGKVKEERIASKLTSKSCLIYIMNKESML
jgi:hypothetical protein